MQESESCNDVLCVCAHECSVCVSALAAPAGMPAGLELPPADVHTDRAHLGEDVRSCVLLGNYCKVVSHKVVCKHETDLAVG